MAINTRDGSLKGRTKVSDLIKYLNDHVDYYGDTDVAFMVDGEKDVTVQFEHYKNAITIDVTENEEDDD